MRFPSPVLGALGSALLCGQLGYVSPAQSWTPSSYVSNPAGVASFSAINKAYRFIDRKSAHIASICEKEN
jgi:hypothetical protein